MKRLNYFCLLCLFLTFTISSCNEEAVQPTAISQISAVKSKAAFSADEEDVFQDIQHWYKRNFEFRKNKTENPRYIAWDGVVSQQLGAGDNWMFTVPIFDREALTKIKRLVILRNEGEMRSFEMEIAPDEDYLAANGISVKENFTGSVKILNSYGRLIKNISLSEGILESEDGLSSMDGLSTLNFGGLEFDNPCDDPAVTCLEEVVVVATPLPNYIWTIIPYPWQPTWNANNVGTSHGQWNDNYYGWNFYVTVQSGPTQVTAAMLQSMIDGLEGLSGAEKVELITQYLLELGDAYLSGSTLRDVVGNNQGTEKIQKISKTGNIIRIEFINKNEVIKFGKKPLVTTLGSGNSFDFDFSSPPDIYIEVNGVNNSLVGPVEKMKIDEEGVKVKKVFWVTVIPFDDDDD